MNKIHAAKTKSIDSKSTNDFLPKQVTKFNAPKMKGGDRSLKNITSSRLHESLLSPTPKMQKENTKKSGNSQLIQRNVSLKGNFKLDSRSYISGILSFNNIVSLQFQTR